MKIFSHIVSTKNQKGLKILVISDLHYFSTKDNYKLEEIIKELRDNQYDAIYLIGDIIDVANVLENDTPKYHSLINFIYSLGSITKTYIACASHDFQYYYFQEKKKKCKERLDLLEERFLKVVGKFPNVYVSKNKVYNLPNGDTVSIIDLDAKIYLKSTYNLEEVEQIIKKEYAFLNDLDANKTNTLLCHYPETIRLLYRLGLLEKVDLSIVGHNHNGLTQLRFFPLEALLNLFGQENRGIITPDKSFSLEKTKNLRGEIKLDTEHLMIINPAITSLSKSSGFFHYFNGLFYRGASVINYVPSSSKDKILKK